MPQRWGHVKILLEEEQIVLWCYTSYARVADVRQQVRAHRRDVPASAHIKLFSGGRQLAADEAVPVGSTLHCVLSAFPALQQAHTEESDVAAPPESPSEPAELPIPWDDGVDPARALLWVVGGVLAFAWAAFLLQLLLRRDWFDRSAMIMLVTMTLVFSLPHIASIVHAAGLLAAPRIVPPVCHDDTRGQGRGAEDCQGIPPRPAALVTGPKSSG